MTKLCHERVVKLLGVIMEDGDYSLVMELIPMGNLKSMLQQVWILFVLSYYIVQCSVWSPTGPLAGMRRYCMRRNEIPNNKTKDMESARGNE